MPAREKSTRNAQRALRAIALELLRLDHELHEIAERLPQAMDTDRMTDDRVPPDLAFELHGAISCTRRDQLRPLVDALLDSATQTPRGLRREYVGRRRAAVG